MLSASAALPVGLTATLAEDKATVAVGGGVTYTLTLTNNTGQPITFQTGSGSIGNYLDVINVGGSLQIVAPSGQTVLPLPSNGVGSSGFLIDFPVTLPPGQSTSATVATLSIANVFAVPGKYTATAAFEFITSPSTAATTVGPLTVTVQ